MDEQNLTVEKGEIRFSFRVAIILKNRDRVLLEKFDDFWNMIGGRVHFGEDTLESAKRELKEELGIEIDDLKLINISENFFPWFGKYQQELLFVYTAELNDDIEITKKEEFKCLDKDTPFKWHNKNDVESLNCKPGIIKKLVMQDAGITHYVIKD